MHADLVTRGRGAFIRNLPHRLDEIVCAPGIDIYRPDPSRYQYLFSIVVPHPVAMHMSAPGVWPRSGPEGICVLGGFGDTFGRLAEPGRHSAAHVPRSDLPAGKYPHAMLGLRRLRVCWPLRPIPYVRIFGAQVQCKGKCTMDRRFESRSAWARYISDPVPPGADIFVVHPMNERRTEGWAAGVDRQGCATVVWSDWQDEWDTHAIRVDTNTRTVSAPLELGDGPPGELGWEYLADIAAGPTGGASIVWLSKPEPHLTTLMAIQLE